MFRQSGGPSSGMSAQVPVYSSNPVQQVPVYSSAPSQQVPVYSSAPSQQVPVYQAPRHFIQPSSGFSSEGMSMFSRPSAGPSQPMYDGPDCCRTCVIL